MYAATSVSATKRTQTIDSTSLQTPQGVVEVEQVEAQNELDLPAAFARLNEFHRERQEIGEPISEVALIGVVEDHCLLVVVAIRIGGATNRKPMLAKIAGKARSHAPTARSIGDANQSPRWDIGFPGQIRAHIRQRGGWRGNDVAGDARGCRCGNWSDRRL